MDGLGGTGGNWKDAVRAAGEGNLTVLQHHLSQGVDPFFQHPEYFTAPIFEAIRKGHLEVVQHLVNYDSKMLDMTEQMSDSTPLEVAFAEKQHAIVNYLLSMQDNKVRPNFIKTMALVGYDTVSDSTTKELVQMIADAGHRVAIILSSAPTTHGEHDETKSSSIDAATEFVRQVQTRTGNSHVYVVEESTALPAPMSPVDIWIGKGDFTTISSVEGIQKSVSSGANIVWCTTDQQQSDQILTTFPAESVSIITTAGWLSYLMGKTSFQSTEIFWVAVEGERNHVYSSGRVKMVSKSSEKGNDWLGL